MQLKSLQIQGFKSFPDKTELTFGTGLTAVVGPNGSGKSNISDAVRWVLGEQSTRSLRGEKMEDVIFLGTSSRKPTGFASVALTIDNTDRQLAVDADEVTIARRLYRSGESEYRINKTAVRLKDVTELLMDTGLGRDGYSIIGQGRIEEIVSSKPTQRREIFEEAAGISKYRYRKAEAEKKLESAYENLLRLKDIMAELQDRLEPLREQSEKAQRFLQLSEEKKTLEISLWTHTMENTRQRLEEEQQQVLLEKNELSDIQALLAEQQHRLEEGFEQVQQLTVRIDTGRQQIAQMKNSLSGCDSGIAVAENDLVHNQRSIDEAHEEILSYTQGKDETKQRFRENQEQLLQKQKLLEKAQQDESLRLNEVDSIEQELCQLTTEIAQMKGSRAALEQDITRQKLNRVSSSALLEETQNRLQSLNDHYSERQQNIESLKKELEECTQLLDGIDQRTLSLENAKAGYGLKYQNQQNQLEQLQQELNRMQSQCDQLRHREGILTEMEKSLDGYYNSVKNVLSAAGQGRLKGIVGTVSQVISVQPQYALAIETVSVLREKGWSIPESALREGLSAARWEARFELLRSDPPVIADGAHNPQCVEALARSLDVYLPGQKVVFLLGVLADKDYETMLARLLPYGKEFICLTPDSHRALGADELCAYLRAKGAPAVSCDTAAEGVRRALEESGGETPVVACGSLYLMGEIRETVKSGG